MEMPEAYCFNSTFEPEPRKDFEVDRHYLLYSASGAMRLEADNQRWTLPPARAALIAANKPICIVLPQKMTTCSVLFSPAFSTPPVPALSVFDMTPLARELVLACRQWGPDSGPLSDYARGIFETLRNVTWRLAATPSPVAVPIAKTEILTRALEITEDRLAENITFEEIAATLATTPRSLSRRFAQELGMTWRQTLRHLRMVRAIEALADSDHSIATVGFSVGYSSLSAFNTAFRGFTGQTPSEYRASFHP